LLRKPRSIILLVPAGAPVDAVISQTVPLLEKNDLLIDSGNSYFKDTDLRTKNLNEKGLLFMGMGISGGEEGARNGPSIMPGGQKEAYERVKPVLQSISAKIKGEPCVAYMGPMSSGHFVKMVHNGIEYGLMQLISETYAVMKLVLEFSEDKIKETYNEWNKSEVSGFLIEITANIFDKLDNITGKRLIDKILDVSRQKGTGMWTSQCAMELQVPVPLIDIAVSMRNLSLLEGDRAQADKIYKSNEFPLTDDPEKIVVQLRKSLFVSMIMTYAQGFSLLTTASEKYGYHLDPKLISRIWRGGCIIRAALLNDIYDAFNTSKDLSNLLLDTKLSQQVKFNQENLRQIICLAGSRGIAIPGLMSALGYLDSFRSAWLPANLIQAQRDYFGGHSYERNDAKGTYHTEWLKAIK
jgi:6-phosphogluconate dehydrogenase